MHLPAQELQDQGGQVLPAIHQGTLPVSGGLPVRVNYFCEHFFSRLKKSNCRYYLSAMK